MLQGQALGSSLAAGPECGQRFFYRALGGYDLGEALGVLECMLRMSQLMCQDLRVSLDIGETLEADEGGDRVRTPPDLGVLDVPRAEPDDRDVS